MMTREQQIAFMENCQERIRGYVSNWMRDPFFKGAFHHRREQQPEEPTPDDGHQEHSQNRKFG